MYTSGTVLKMACIEAIPQGHYCFDAEGICPYYSTQKISQYSKLEPNEFCASCKGMLRKFFKKITLMKTIPVCYDIWERIKIFFTGKICRCKFCQNYFIRPQDATNVTQCAACFFKMLQSRTK